MEYYEHLHLKNPQELSDAELLSIFLGQGISSKDSLTLAYELLEKFGNLSNIIESNPYLLNHLTNTDKRKLILIRLAPILAQRHLKTKIINSSIASNSENVYLYLKSNLTHQQHEIFGMLLLDSHYQIITYEELFHGTINKVVIYPREIARIALLHNSAAVIFAHNHPMNTSLASRKDISLTKSLTKILAKIEIKVLDHIVIGIDGYRSILNK